MVDLGKEGQVAATDSRLQAFQCIPHQKMEAGEHSKPGADSQFGMLSCSVSPALRGESQNRQIGRWISTYRAQQTASGAAFPGESHSIPTLESKFCPLFPAYTLLVKDVVNRLKVRTNQAQ